MAQEAIKAFDAKDGKAAVAVADTGPFALAVLQAEGIQDIVQANLAPMGRVQFERVKMPSGGGLAFEMVDENGNPASVAEIVGVILDHYPVNAYWADKFAGGNAPPACSALDGRTGVGNPGGACVRCPFNQWGSEDGGRGKACKNLHRVYVLPTTDVLPLLVAAPPTSLANIAGYMRLLTSKAKRPHWAVITRIKLERATNKDGIAFSRATFSRAGDVPAESLANLRSYIEEMRPLMRAVEIAAADYDGTAEQGNGGADSAAAADAVQPF